MPDTLAAAPDAAGTPAPPEAMPAAVPGELRIGNLRIFADSASDRAKLFAKLSRVLEAMHRVPKNGNNTQQNYKYATEADTADTVRPALAAEGLALSVTVADLKYTEGKTNSGGVKWTVHAWLDMAILDGETGAVVVTRWLGEGQDSLDKASYKAYTGAVKYWMMKSFLLATGDDPERDRDDAAAVGIDDAGVALLVSIENRLREIPPGTAGKVGRHDTPDLVRFVEANRTTWYNNRSRARDVSAALDDALTALRGTMSVAPSAAAELAATVPAPAATTSSSPPTLLEEARAERAAAEEKARGREKEKRVLPADHQEALDAIMATLKPIPEDDPLAMLFDGVRIDDARKWVLARWALFKDDKLVAVAFLEALRQAITVRAQGGELKPAKPEGTPITQQKIGRLWGVARRAGYNDGGLHEMLAEEFGCHSVREITEPVFNRVVDRAKDEKAAERFNELAARRAEAAPAREEEPDEVEEREPELVGAGASADRVSDPGGTFD